MGFARASWRYWPFTMAWHGTPFRLTWNPAVPGADSLLVWVKLGLRDSLPIHSTSVNIKKWTGLISGVKLYSSGPFPHLPPQGVQKNLVLIAEISTYYLQDGGVEGCVFIFSCENSKITTHWWKTIDRRMLDPTKKRYPRSKGKGEAQERW